LDANTSLVDDKEEEKDEVPELDFDDGDDKLDHLKVDVFSPSKN
jgi:hypothetical protein